MKIDLAIGTYSEPILFGTGELFCGKGKGIYLCEFDGENIEIKQMLELGNPSYLDIDETKRKIYAVNEMKTFQGVYGGGVTEIDYDEKGHMTVAASYPTDGADPCHVAISPDKKWLGIANFADGKVTFFRLDERGKIQPDKQVFAHIGSSVHPIRQKGPHAHSVIFDGMGKALVPDLGMDRLVSYICGAERVDEVTEKRVSVAAGNGPRFGEFSPNHQHFYLINELGSSITHFAWNEDGMDERETIRTLPEDYTGDNICSDLHITPDGRYLYASNRGHDSITSFGIDENGRLQKLGCQSCRGKTPRNFAIDPSGKYLLVGNQDSDTISIFEIQENGQLMFMSQIDFPTPVCIRFFHKMI